MDWLICLFVGLVWVFAWLLVWQQTKSKKKGVGNQKSIKSWTQSSFSTNFGRIEKDVQKKFQSAFWKPLIFNFLDLKFVNVHLKSSFGPDFGRIEKDVQKSFSPPPSEPLIFNFLDLKFVNVHLKSSFSTNLGRIEKDVQTEKIQFLVSLLIPS